MKKIMFFVSSMQEGGAQRVISLISNILVEKEYQIEILTYFNEDIFYNLNSNIKINSVIKNTNSSNILKNINWIKKYFRNCDVIISFLAPFNIIALLANKGNKTPIIVADRNDPNKVPSNKIIRKVRDILYKQADLVVTQTNDNNKYFDYISNKCFVIPNPLDMKEYQGLALKTEKKNKIVSVGRLEEQKNQIMLIKAFKEFKDYYELVIYGEGSYRKTLEDKINELRLNDKVILFGNSKDVFNEIKDAKLFVLSSNYEGMPNALAEAMCLGLPCISTKVSGVSDLIENGVNGEIVPINDKESLIKTMNKILSNDAIANSYGLEASKLADKLNVDIITDKWIELIEQI